MSNEPSILAIHDYADSNNPYIRGLYNEGCDYLLRLAEAWRPPTIKIGDLDSKFPGYAKGAQEASKIFGTCIQELEDVLDVLDELLNRGITITLPDRFVNDKDSTTAGGMARTHAHHLATARRLEMRLGMTADETREADVRTCRAQISDAIHHFQDMQDAAYDLSEKYWALLNQAGYESDDVFGESVTSSLLSGARRPPREQVSEEDTEGGYVDERRAENAVLAHGMKTGHDGQHEVLKRSGSGG